jgi:hypothetical protein
MNANASERFHTTFVRVDLRPVADDEYLKPRDLHRKPPATALPE